MKRCWPILLPAALMAHMVSMSTGELHIEGRQARYQLRMPLYEVAHIRDPGHALLDHFQLRAGAEAKTVSKNCAAEQDAFVCDAVYEFPAPVDSVDVECSFAAITAPNHVHLLRAFKDGKTDQAVFDLSFTTAELRFRPPTAFEEAVRGSGAGFMRAVGGLAPLLFLASLALAARNRRELLLNAAAFMAAEILACLIAPQRALQLSPRFIEAAAALTVAYLAFEILLLPNSNKRWLVVGLLGLFHGAYFSLFLEGSGDRLLPFLAGVIAGEALLIAFFGLALRPLPRIPRATTAAASLLLAAGLAWFVVRIAP